jgi:RNA polymerase sigma-70 factor (ECF subfamily)
MITASSLKPTDSALTDEQVVERVLAGERALFEILMRRHNPRLFHAARAIVRDDMEAEDVMQDAYVRAYASLGQFEGRAKFATWLTKIAINEALARRRHGNRQTQLDANMDDEDYPRLVTTPRDDPERATSNRELATVLEAAIESLPEGYRLAFVLRDVDGLSTTEAAECLGISEDALKVRLHRAHTALRALVEARLGEAAKQVYGFEAPRCNRVVDAVFARLAALD